MNNYYFLFDLDMNLPLEEIKKSIEKLKKKYIKQLNSPNMDKQAEAQKKLNTLEEADKVFRTEETKKAYDLELSNTRHDETSSASSNTNYHENRQTANNELTYLYDEAIDAIQKGDGPNAVAAATKAYNLAPNNHFANFVLGHAHRIFGNNEDAYNYFSNSIKLDPKFADGYRDLGKILISSFGRYEEGKRRLEQCLQITPDDESALSFLVDWNKQNDDKTVAKKYLEELVKYYPNDHNYQTQLQEIKNDESIEYSENLELLADVIYLKGYFDSKEEYDDYIQKLEVAKIYHATPSIEEKLFKAKVKEGMTVDIKLLAWLFPITIFNVVNASWGLSILVALAAALVIYFAIIPKWKLEKRKRNAKFGSLWASGILYFLAITGTCAFILSIFSNFKSLILIIIFAAIYKFALPKLNTKKVISEE